MLQLGDKVRFVNENLEGFITRVIDKSTFGVTIEDDFEIPVPASNLVKVKFEPKAAKPVEETTKQNLSKHPLGIYLAFERIGDSTVQAYLYQNSAQEAFVAAYQKKNDIFNNTFNDILSKDNAVKWNVFSLENFNEWSNFNFQVIWVEPKTARLPKPQSFDLSINAKVFHQSLKFCFFLEKQAHVFQLDQLVPLDLTKLKSKDFSEKVVLAKPDLKQKPHEVIDLHYESLLAKGFGSTQDIIGLQMEVFTQSFDAALQHGMKKITFIHGVGNMYLKNKIHTYLSKYKHLLHSYQLASDLMYGSGATEVIIK